MKDRQFMVILVLVVVAGLVMGLVAFRVTGSAPAAQTASAGSTAGKNPAVPEPYTVEVPTETQSDAPLLASGVPSQNGEPVATDKDAPEMQGPANGDPPQVAAAPPADAGGEPSQ